MTISDTHGYGKRLVTHVIDRRAYAPTKSAYPYACIANGSKVQDGYREISYACLANAVNRACQWLWDGVGRPAKGEAIMYVGPFDLRYQILSLAVVKSGHVLFLPSPRNTPDALRSLAHDADCTTVISPAEPPRPVQVALAESPGWTHVVVPPLAFFLDEAPAAHIPLTATWEELRYSTWLIIHTSGSTNNAKLVRLTHGCITAVDGAQSLPNVEASRFKKTRFLLPFPPFHVAGILYSFAISVYYESAPIFPPAGAPLTADLVHAIHLQTPVDHYILAPSLVADLTNNSVYLEKIKSLKGLTFSGGPLGTDVARLVSERTPLSSGFGASEYGALATQIRDPEDWQYFALHMEGGGFDMRKVGDEDLYELVMIRQPALALTQAVFYNYPEETEFHTKDLFSKHPTKAGLYKYESRLDDILVLSHGENLNPVPMESCIVACPEIKGCVVVGQGRAHAIALLEPAKQDSHSDALLTSVRPYIDQANALCPAYGKLSLQALLVLAPGESFPRAAKGTVQRPKVLKLFAEKVDAFYASMDNGTAMAAASHAAVTIDASSEQSLEASLSKLIGAELETGFVGRDQDFFALGMDSLIVLNIVRAINRSSQASPVDATVVYNNPTVAQLTSALVQPPRRKEYSDFDEDDEDDKQAWLEMEKQYVTLRQNPSGGQKRSLVSMLRSSRPAPIFQPSRGWLAWSQVLGAFLVNLTNWGLVNSFGVYQVYYQTELLQHHSPSSISWIGTVQGALLLIVGVLSGPLFDKGFFRLMLIGGGLALVVSLMLLSLATEYYQIMLCQGLLSGLSLGVLYLPSVAMIPLYFKKHRGLALGIATAGGSAGGVFHPIVFRRLIEVSGFGWANRIIGFVVLVSLAIAVTLIKPVGKRSTRQLLDAAALREVPYLAFLGTAFCVFAGVMVPFFLSPSFALFKIGLSENKSFYYLCILNGAQCFGRIAAGGLADAVGPEILLLLSQVGSGIMALCWIGVGSESGLIAWMTFYGLLSGGIVTLPTAVLPYICPSLAMLGTRLGMVYAMAGIGFLISTPVALALDSHSDGFLGAQIWAGCCCIVGAVLYLITCKEAWQQRRRYESRNKRKG